MSALSSREAALAAENRHLKNRIRSYEGHCTRRHRQAEPAPAQPVDVVGDLLATVAARNPDAYQRIAPRLGRIV